MPSEDYHKAMRQGLKEVKAAQALGEETGPRTLPDAPEKLAVRRESLGLAEIDGTCNHLRGDAFSRGFYPILPADTEFAAKWSALCRIHLEEGIRDPVKVVEYLNHFYVMEGHKRVSVLKYFGAITIPATVTRLLPKPSDDPEVAAYYEFLDFYKMTGLNFIVFRQPGSTGPLRQRCLECGRHLLLPGLLLYVPGRLPPGGLGLHRHLPGLFDLHQDLRLSGVLRQDALPDL